MRCLLHDALYCYMICFALLYIGHACFMMCFSFAIGACCQYAVLCIAIIHALLLKKLLALSSYRYILLAYCFAVAFPCCGPR